MIHSQYWPTSGTNKHITLYPEEVVHGPGYMVQIGKMEELAQMVTNWLLSMVAFYSQS